MRFKNILEGLLGFLSITACGDVNLLDEPKTFCESSQDNCNSTSVPEDGVCPEGTVKVRKSTPVVRACPVAL